LVKLRLARMGNRKRPFYRVVAAEEAYRRDGRFIEILGTYDPLRKPAAIEVKSEAVLKWLSNGAQPTDTVKRILAKTGVWAHWQAYRSGSGPLDMTGRQSGTLERARDAAPSKKVVTKLAEEEKEKAEAAAKAKADAAKAKAAAASSEGAGAPADEAAS
jgi:small subunit ribosomal protein S16